MTYHVISYLIYAPISIAITIWVGTILFRNGRVFLLDIFAGNTLLTDSINRLLISGFYLLSIGYAIFALPEQAEIGSLQSMIERLSIKLGIILLILGLIHFFNLLVLSQMRSRSAKTNEQ